MHLKPNETKKIIEKTNLHPRNLHRQGYDFNLLIQNYPVLNGFVGINNHGLKTIDFSNPAAVKALNNALLITYYGILNWYIPDGYLCPAIPGRSDYIHHIADLLATSNNGVIPVGENVLGLDIGIGANCIYPIIGNGLYDWHFIGTDVYTTALDNCEMIMKNNPKLIAAISLQLQTKPRFIFKNIIKKEDKFTFTICNPPFHASQKEATKSTIRKVNNLEDKKTTDPILNFGGQNAELWCDGGELGFITQMIYESTKYPLQCLWFTTLVSKKENLAILHKILNKVSACEVKTIDMAQGQKTSRILAWTFLSEIQQKKWKF